MNIRKWFIREKKADPMIEAQAKTTQRKMAAAEQASMVLKSLTIERRCSQEDFDGPDRRTAHA